MNLKSSDKLGLLSNVTYLPQQVTQPVFLPLNTFHKTGWALSLNIICDQAQAKDAPRATFPVL